MNAIIKPVATNAAVSDFLADQGGVLMRKGKKDYVLVTLSPVC